MKGTSARDVLLYFRKRNFLQSCCLLPYCLILVSIVLLVGFGRACAPVRCAHPSFLTHCHSYRGAVRPSPPIKASLLLIRPPKINKIYWNSPPAWRAFQKISPSLQAWTWASHVKGFFLSTGPQRLWNRRSPAPCPACRSFADPSGNSGSKLCTGETFYEYLLILLLLFFFSYIWIC